MIHAKIEKLNKNNFEALTNGEWFDKSELYELLDALCEYNNWCIKHKCCHGERQIFQDVIKKKLQRLINEDLEKRC